MRIWLALIVSPLLALTDQTVAFAMVGWACAHQSVALLHASHALFLAATTAAAATGKAPRRRTHSVTFFMPVPFRVVDPSAA